MMTDASEATPRPWELKQAKQGRLDTDESRDWGIGATIGDRKYCIAETFWRVDQLDFAPSEANAALIVLAVNSHDALVKALQRLRNETSGLMNMCEHEIRRDAGNTNFGCLEGAVELADAALALAKGEPG